MNTFLLFRAFWSFHSHYPAVADSLFNSLDAKAQKLLQTGSQGAFGSMKSLKDGYSSSTTNNYDAIDSVKKPAVVTSSSHTAGKFNLFFTH